VCGSSTLQPYRERSDGVVVLKCSDCGMGVTSAIPDDPAAYYGDTYYAGTADGFGYQDYATEAEHSVTWAAALVRLIRPTGRVLDIGCADGRFLAKLIPDYECDGIEVNERMAAASRDRGIDIVASDIFDPRLAERRGAYDVVTALAVFEHTLDFKRAIEVAASLLDPHGFLLFEVPLVGGSVDDDVWFRTSLEHIWYPTAQAIEHVFAAIGLPLAGKEQEIVDFGSTYVGIASHRSEVLERFGELVSDPHPGTPEALRFQALFELVHSGRVDARTIALASSLTHEDINDAMMHRLSALWAAQYEKLQRAMEQSAELTSALEVADRAHRQELEEAYFARDAARTELEALRGAAAEPSSARTTTPDDHASHDEEGEIAKRDSPIGTRMRRAAARAAFRAQSLAKGGFALASTFKARRARTAIRLLVRRDLETFRVRANWLVDDRRERRRRLEARLRRRTVHAVPLEAGQPLVSVVVVCFNYGRYLDEAVSSVLAQTAFSLSEVIVVDGGSDDSDTIETVERLAADPPDRTTVLLRRDDRHFVGDNRNFGIEHAKGRYVMCLDADDTVDPRYLEIALYLLERRGYDVVSTATQSVGLDTTIYGLKRTPTLADMLAANNVTTVAVFRRALWERAGGYFDAESLGGDYIAEDWKLWVRMSALGARIANIEAPFFRYRVHSASSLSQKHDIPGRTDLHREEIRRFNADVVDDAALKHSTERRDLDILVEGAFSNLSSRSEDSRPTILIAMPFMLVGGAERLLAQVATHLARVGHRVVIVTTDWTDAAFGDSSTWFRDATAEIYDLPSMIHDDWEDFVDYILETKGVDVVLLAGSGFMYDQLPRLKALHPGLRVADLLFNTEGHTASNRRYRDLIDLHLCENGEVKDWLIREGEREDAIVLVESGVDVSAYEPRPHVDGPLRVGFSGRLSKEKCPLAFVDVAELLVGPDFEFVMTGAGPLEDKVRERVDRLPADSAFRFLGVVDDIAEHLASLDVLVVPSALDGRPLVVLEALAAGTPVIATRVGGIPALVHDGVSGYLVEPGDTAAIARHLARLAHDPALLDSLQRSAREHAVANLNVTSMNEGYERAITSLLE